MIRFILSVALALVGALGPTFAPQYFHEDYLDELRALIHAHTTTATVAIIEMRSGQAEWPLKRSRVADVARVALENGAVAVAIDIDMSFPTEESEDRTLLALVSRNPRVLPLRLVGFDQSMSQEFALNASGEFLGVACPNGNTGSMEPFAVRVAAAGGIDREQIYKHCIGSILRPYIYAGTWYPVVTLANLSDGKVEAVRDRFAIIGTTDPLGGIQTSDGPYASTLINASVIQSAHDATWRGSNALLSITIYSFLLVCLSLGALTVKDDKSYRLYCAVVLLILLIIRYWIWFTTWPAAILVLGSFLAGVMGRRSNTDKPRL